MRDVVKTDKAPGAIGPYSQAIKITCAKLVFCSGQIPIDPATGELVGNTAGEQCVQVLKNLKAVLEAAGTDLEHVVKTTMFLKDMNDFTAVNEAYAGFFAADPPARAAVEVARLPKDVRVEIEAIAMVE
jgi:2-iminobutanoate/2-iminopropanoate deaminase